MWLHIPSASVLESAASTEVSDARCQTLAQFCTSSAKSRQPRFWRRASRRQLVDKKAPGVWSDLGTVCGPECGAYLREVAPGGIDWLIGGFPCQPHSVAGKKKGADDERDLWPLIERFIEHYRPRGCFFENVPGILGYLSARPIPFLRRAGYVVPRPCLLEAASVGASQKRERIFILAYSARDGDARCDGQAWSGRGVRQGNQAMVSPERGTDERRGRRGESPCPTGENATAAQQRQRSGDAPADDGSAMELASDPQRGRGSVRQPSGSGGLAQGSDGQEFELPADGRGNFGERVHFDGERLLGSRGEPIRCGAFNCDRSAGHVIRPGEYGYRGPMRALCAECFRGVTRHYADAMGNGGEPGLSQRAGERGIQSGAGEPGQGQAAELRDGELAFSDGAGGTGDSEPLDMGNAERDGRQARSGDARIEQDAQARTAENPELRSRRTFGPFPPGPGFGLDRVVEKVLESLESGEAGADDRFLAELAEWAKWQQVLEARPDLAPAISEDEAAAFECEICRVANGSNGRLGVSRADQLRALGNGVVSAQAEAAFRILVQRIEVPV